MCTHTVSVKIVYVVHDKIVLYAAAVCLGSVESSVACDAARRGGIDY